MCNEITSILRALANGRVLKFDGPCARIGPVTYSLAVAQGMKVQKLMAYKASAGGYVSSKRGRAEAAKLLPIAPLRFAPYRDPDPRYGVVVAGVDN